MPTRAGSPYPGGDPARCLRCSNVSKTFGGTRALNGGVAQRSAGARSSRSSARTAPANPRSSRSSRASTRSTRAAVSYRGRDASHSLRRLPVAFIHQDLGLIDWMTVAENICLTLGYPRRLGLVDWAAARRRAAAALEILGADIDPDVRIQSLSRTEKSLVAIARALAAEAEILVLDEPTASLPADEVGASSRRSGASATAASG